MEEENLSPASMLEASHLELFRDLDGDEDVPTASAGPMPSSMKRDDASGQGKSASEESKNEDQVDDVGEMVSSLTISGVMQLQCLIEKIFVKAGLVRILAAIRVQIASKKSNGKPRTKSAPQHRRDQEGSEGMLDGVWSVLGFGSGAMEKETEDGGEENGGPSTRGASGQNASQAVDFTSSSSESPQSSLPGLPTESAWSSVAFVMPLHWLEPGRIKAVETSAKAIAHPSFVRRSDGAIRCVQTGHVYDILASMRIRVRIAAIGV